MSTSTTATTEEHTPDDEIYKLAHPKQSPKARIGMIASYVGMAVIVLYCIIPFYWMVVSSLRLPTEGRSTEFVPNPVSFANYAGRLRRRQQLRPVAGQLDHRLRGDHGARRCCSASSRPTRWLG